MTVVANDPGMERSAHGTLDVLKEARKSKVTILAPGDEDGDMDASNHGGANTTSPGGRRRSFFDRFSHHDDSPQFPRNKRMTPGRSTQKLMNLASLLNSPSMRRLDDGLGDTDASGRKRRTSRDAVAELLAMESTVTMSELTHIKELGEGGFATVGLYSYSPSGSGSVPDGLAADPSTDASDPKLVALKVMKSKIPDPNWRPAPGVEGEPPPMVDVPDSWRRTFQSEALVLKALRHPNVVACYGCVQPSVERLLFEDGKEELMFLQEFCPGGTLEDKVHKPRSYTALEALTWVTDVAEGMAYLHSRPGIKIAHRDLKLENILLSDKGVAKVGDFGLSRLVVGEDVQSQSPGPEPQRSSFADPELGDSHHLPAPKVNNRMSVRRVSTFLSEHLLPTTKKAQKTRDMTGRTVRAADASGALGSYPYPAPTRTQLLPIRMVYGIIPGPPRALLTCPRLRMPTGFVPLHGPRSVPERAV